MSPEKNDSFEKSLRDLRYKEFVIELLDSRHSIEQMLNYKRSKHYASYQGFRNELYLPPGYLSELLPGAASSATLDFSTNDTGNELTITDLTISTDNHRPVFIHKELDLDLVEAERGSDILVLDSNALETTLLSFLPERARQEATIEQAIKALSMFSPEKDEVTTFFGEGPDFLGEVRFSNVETFNNSIQVLEIINRKAHVSGATIGTRLRITESILDRMQTTQSQQVNQSLDIHATKTPEPIVTIEDILNENGRFVEVLHPTQAHIDDINSVLELLR